MINTRKLHWTPREASKTLPLVRRIVEDILAKGHRWKALREGDEMFRTPEKEDEIDHLAEEIREHMKEFEEIGCSFKDWDFDVGLVDFPSKIDGREVLLCWKNDEDRLEWYHEPKAGFDTRQRIPKELLEAP